MKKDAFKKHHFWFLTGAVPLLVFILFILLLTEPDEAIADSLKKYNDKVKEVTGAKANGKGVLADLDAQKGLLDERRETLWKVNYERQKAAGVFKWPRVAGYRDAATLDAFERLDLRFGAKLVEKLEPNPALADRQFVQGNEEIAKFTNAGNYAEAYKQLAESVAPTLFDKGDWRTVLRYVSDWKTGRPPWEQFWLALEDYWVQKVLLAPVAEVNAVMARFEEVPAAAGTTADPLKPHLQSRIWDLRLEIVSEGGATFLKSKLKNRTDRLQLLGAGKQMKLKVWFNKPEQSQPFEYRIEGEFVRGNEEMVPRFVPALHRLPAGLTPEKVYCVEQVFDTTTAPVRLVRRIDLGFTDSKRAGTDLKPPKFLEDEPPPAGTAPAPGVAPATMPGPRVDPAMPVAGGAAGVLGATGPKTGTHDEVLLGNKKRYLEVTEQIRRMPVAVVLVVDQAYVNDLLVAYSNSPLRFQTTQVQMQRFRETLPITPPTGTTGPAPAPVAPPLPFGPRGPEAGPFAGGQSGSSASVTDSQATAGLTEVAVFGIVTFYEKYAEKPKAAPAPPAVAPPAPAPAVAPNPAAPKPTTATPAPTKPN